MPAFETSDAAVGAAVTSLEETRDRTHELVSVLDDQQLESVHSTLLSPLVWDLAHIAAFEDLWISRGFGVDLLHEELITVYDADETPRADRGSLPLLRTDEAFAFQQEVRDRTLALIDGADERRVDCDRLELVIRHEQQHNETMLQALQIAHLPAPFGSGSNSAATAPRVVGDGLEPVEIAGGEITIGFAGEGFAYDNERPAHTVGIAPFGIGRTPVTNAAWLEFIDGGGYARREWWSDAGWAWRCEEQIERPGGWTDDGHQWRLGDCLALDPAEPVIHISFHEAEAFAASHGARLPTEFEWECCASTGGCNPWGDAEPTPQLANIDQLAGGPLAAGCVLRGASDAGVIGLVGDVWEWTSTHFHGYRGFVAYPYREYSEQFFGHGYRVLRGGSWATRPRMATPTFRNWDLPQRRQIFSGVRLAWDAD